MLPETLSKALLHRIPYIAIDISMALDQGLAGQERSERYRLNGCLALINYTEIQQRKRSVRSQKQVMPSLKMISWLHHESAISLFK